MDLVKELKKQADGILKDDKKRKKLEILLKVYLKNQKSILKIKNLEKLLIL